MEQEESRRQHRAAEVHFVIHLQFVHQFVHGILQLVIDDEAGTILLVIICKQHQRAIEKGVIEIWDSHQQPAGR